MTFPRTLATAAGPSISTSEPWCQAIALAAIRDHDCQQDPHELAALLTYLQQQIRPALVLEIGGWNGGSAWAWHMLTSAPRVLTVTLPDSPLAARADQLPPWHEVIWADSTDADTVRLVKRQLRRQRPEMVFIDGSHHYEDAADDWRNYGPLTAQNGVTVFHDINDFPNHPDLQVHLLWPQLQAQFRTVELISQPGQACGTGILWPCQPLTSQPS